MPPVKKIVVKKQAPTQLQKKKGTPNTILNRIAPVSLEDNSIKMCLYGRSGSGKTTLACTFPKPLLIIGFEDGTKSVHNVDGVDFVRVLFTNELSELLEGVNGKYKSYLLDTATALQDMHLKEILGLDELPAQLSWGIASREDWGQTALKTKECLRAVLNLDGNVIVTAQERQFTANSADSDVVIPYVGSALSPSVAGWLNPACDYIGQTFIREETATKTTKIGGKVMTTEVKTGKKLFCLRVGPSEVYTTKFRLPKKNTLPEYVVDPSYEKILKLISGKV